MKILYVITLADGGGAQQYVLMLARHFKGAIAAGTEETRLFEEARAAGLETFGLKHLRRAVNPYHDLLAIFELVRLIKKYKPDIIHLNSTKAGFLGSIAGKLAKCKVVFTAHGFRYSEPLSPASRRFYLWLEKFASLLRDRIIAVSQADYNSAIVNHIAPPKKLCVIYNGIGPIDFLPQQQARDFLKLNHNKLIFGTIANFYKTKGLDVLIEAVSKLDKTIQDKCQFVIIGHGPEQNNLRFKISDLRLQETVLLPGNIENAKQYLKAFDIFILPSRKEGFPFALLEALQAGLPIIATNVGGNGEITGNAGMLVPPENPKALAEAVVELFSSQEKREKLSQKSLSRALLFTQDKLFEKTRSVYQQL